MKTVNKLYLVIISIFLISIFIFDSCLCLADDLSIESQLKINGVNVSERGIRIIDNSEMECSFKLTNTGISSESVVVLLSTYTSTGTLHTIKMYNMDVEPGQTTNLEFSYLFDAEKEYTGKIMIWNSLSKIMPLRASVDFSQNSGTNAYYYNANNRLIQIDKTNGTSLIFTYDNMGNVISKTIRK